jgi:hypothetical protein
MKHPINMPPITGDTPQDLIDLQHDTWAYELKVWAESKQQPRAVSLIQRFVRLLGIA